MNVFELPEECERAEFKDIIAQNGGIMILKFGADWCGPCQKIKPYAEQECLNDLEKHNRDSKSPKNLFLVKLLLMITLISIHFLRRRKWCKVFRTCYVMLEVKMMNEHTIILQITV